ncbi:MAG: CoA pyrophosphatase [Limnohabitans sp.]
MAQASFVSLAQIPDFSPHDVEVLGTDTHLPAVPLHALSEASLRDKFARPFSVSATAFHEPLWSNEPPKPASVLLGVVMHAQPSVLLTVRTAHLSSHSGQVALPGGRKDPQDADEIATALREAQEEVGLHPDFVSVLGCLPVYVTGTGYRVTPVVALLNPAMKLAANPQEVADVFEVPLAYLMDPANHRRHAVQWRGVTREWFSMPYDTEHKQRLIWGATAGILRHFYHFLSAGD